MHAWQQKQGQQLNDVLEQVHQLALSQQQLPQVERRVEEYVQQLQSLEKEMQQIATQEPPPWFGELESALAFSTAAH